MSRFLAGLVRGSIRPRLLPPNAWAEPFWSAPDLGSRL